MPGFSPGSTGTMPKALPAPTERVDPFAAYMSWRPRSDASKDWGAGQLGCGKLVTQLPVSYFGKLPKPEEDPFACYMNLRPPKMRTAPEAEQTLREEVLRAKKKFLEVAVKAEEKAMERGCPEEMRSSIRQMKHARLYLRNPLIATSALCDMEEEEEEKERLEREAQEALETDEHGLPRSPSRRADGRPGSAEAHRTPSPMRRMKTVTILGGTDIQLSQGQSMPNLHRAGSGGLGLQIDTNLPASKRVSTGRTPMSKRVANAIDEPVLSGWYSQTRLWNLSVTRNSQSARRHSLEYSGGAIVLGNGRMPLYTGRHLMSPGYYYNFTIGEVDDKFFPINKVRDLSFAFGVSRLPGHDRACTRPTYAYEVEGTVLVGYGARMIDQGRWYETNWDPKVLEPGDEVGVLVGMEGDMAIFVNGTQVLRMKTSLCDDAREILKSPSSKSKKRALFPIVDLHGRVCNVQIGMRKAPPNVPLEAMKRLNLAPLLKTPPPPPPPPTP
eukprot:TRINITY_DN82593_c0_g1_i1.p1 TRINITY_DN82593_c0_g1~~TRINITY_DN82593_c0_g1_i1.p1  ORF type:complete len:498 (+),score=116.37 TRINITY_DN82593_c0_g1_i1:161-1654(+)